MGINTDGIKDKSVKMEGGVTRMLDLGAKLMDVANLRRWKTAL